MSVISIESFFSFNPLIPHRFFQWLGWLALINNIPSPSQTLPSLPSVSVAITISTMYIRWQAQGIQMQHSSCDFIRAIHSSRPNTAYVCTHVCTLGVHSPAPHFPPWTARAEKIYLIGMKWQRNRQPLALIYCHFVGTFMCLRSSLWVCGVDFCTHIHKRHRISK